MMVVQGEVAVGYEPLRDALALAMEGDPGGARLCFYRRGQAVADLWCGQNLIRARPYTGETIGVVMSASKGVTAACAHLLIERGQLELEAPSTPSP